MYYIYRADCQQKVLLNEVPATVPTKVKKHDNEPILRVGRGEQASRLSERVIRGAVRHFEMPSHMGAVRAARQARDVIPPAVFEESQTGVVRVVYKEVVIRFGSKVDRKRRKQILDKHNLKIRRKTLSFATRS